MRMIGELGTTGQQLAKTKVYTLKDSIDEGLMMSRTDTICEGKVNPSSVARD